MLVDQIAYTDVLGVPIDAVNMPMTLALIDGWIRDGGSRYICPTSVDCVMACRDDPEVRRIYQEAALLTPDGMSMVWMSKLRGFSHVERVYGPDLTLALCGHGRAQSYRHFFYGGAPGVAQRMAERLSERYPGLLVAGWWSPPFRPLTYEEDRAVVKMINEAAPDVVWVGLGAPKQDRWMAAHTGRLHAPVMIGIGAAFDFLAGTKRQAPAPLRRAGLEMVFRVATEPSRLGKRFLRNHPRFVLLAAAQLLFRRRSTVTGVRASS